MEDERRAEALEALERVGYVDDARFAEGRATSLADRGFGDEAIRELLAADGISRSRWTAAVGSAPAGGRAGRSDRGEPRRVAADRGSARPEGLR